MYVVMFFANGIERIKSCYRFIAMKVIIIIIVYVHLTSM